MRTDRLEAAARGEKTYQGKPCKRDHGGLRYTLTGNCIECMRLTQRASREQLRKLLAENA